MDIRSAFLVATLIAATSGVAGAESIDTRDPRYQASLAKAAEALQAARAAQRSLIASEETNPLPGVDYIAMLGALQRIEETLSVVVAPQERRYRHRVLVPDAPYFKPHAPKP